MEYLVAADYCFLDVPGGSGRVAWDVAVAMRDRGHSVTYVCFQAVDSEPPGISTTDGIRIVRFRKGSLPPWHPGRLQVIVDSTTRASLRWLMDRTFDAVHVHSPLPGLGVLAALGNRPRYVFTVHSPLVMEQEITWRHQGWTGWLKLLTGRRMLATAERGMLAGAARIHTLSEFTRQQLDASYGVGSRITVIPHWYTPHRPRMEKAAARALLGWPENAKIFFTVRGLAPRYGLDVAIRALAPLVRDSDAYFYLAGRGHLRAELEALGRSLGAGDKIRFMGRVSDETLELAYAAADLFILPTVALECFGLITVEALTFGCPVLGTDAAAIPESLRPILPEMIVPAGNVAALREKARAFLGGSIVLPGRQALIDYAAAHYSEGTVVPRIAALFDDSATA